jgi:phospho-N-acetylmuramoyl-pentapeptide-transferase
LIALLIGGVVSIAVVLVITPLFIAWIKDRSIGQQIRDDGPKGHHTKAGTPTIGGVCIVAGCVAGYVSAHTRIGAVYTYGGLAVMTTVVLMGLVGFIDDWIKVRNSRSLGLTSWQKMAGQVGVALIFAVIAIHWAHVSTKLSWTRYDLPGINLGRVGWTILAVVLIVGFSNAVNLTDGLDGLAAGSSAFTFATFAAIGFWELRHQPVYHVPHQVPESLDLALVAIALGGACVGFLWWNAAPAKIFMGDTGSLAIGAGMAAIALVLNVQLLLFICGGLFVIETASVILQVATFKLFKRKRLFRMAPIHHHFELLGWPETHVIIRFWILAGMFTALALGFFYADFLSLNVAS